MPLPKNFKNLMLPDSEFHWVGPLTRSASTSRTQGRTLSVWDVLVCILILALLGGLFAAASVVVVEGFGIAPVVNSWKLWLGWTGFCAGLTLLKCFIME